MKRIAVIGVACTDVVASPVNSYPEMGAIYCTKSIKTFVGGSAANCAIDFSRLGMKNNVQLCCKLGDDAMGNFVKNEIAAQGVDTSFVVMDKNLDTSVSIVYINTEVSDRYAVLSPSSISAFKREDVKDVFIDNADIVFVAGFLELGDFDKDCGKLFEECRKKGKLTVLDTMWDLEDVWWPKLQPVLSTIDLFMPSYDECYHLTGTRNIREMIAIFRKNGAGDMVIKIGKRGVVIARKDAEPYILGACENVEAIDTVGAGDAFCAGTLTGLAHGMTLDEAAKLGCATSAFCIQGAGTYSGVRSMEESLEFLKTHPCPVSELE